MPFARILVIGLLNQIYQTMYTYLIKIICHQLIIINFRNVIAEEVWIGLKEINSNGIWIWADGSASDQGIGRYHYISSK